MESSHIELNIFLIDLFTFLKHHRNKKQRINQANDVPLAYNWRFKLALDFPINRASCILV